MHSSWRCFGADATASFIPAVSGVPLHEGSRQIDQTEIECASSETVRRINCDIVLSLIRKGQPISRADIARQSGLQRSTVSLIVEQLIRERWACDTPVVNWTRGRRPTLVRLNDDLRAIAIDVRPNLVNVGVIDLSGRLHTRIDIPVEPGTPVSVSQIVDTVNKVREINRSCLIEGIGISISGRVDPSSQRLVFAPNLHWADFDLRAAIQSEVGLPVRMENAANACLIAARTFGHLAGIRNIVLVSISEGVGAGILANGELVTGDGGRAGEFGHVPVDPHGPRCACGRYGCWEVFASCNAALRYYRELEPDHHDITFRELIRNAEDGDSKAVRAIHEHATQIGRGLGMVIAGLAPGIVLISGEITTAWARYGAAIESEAAHATITGPLPHILPAEGGELARLKGAAALEFERRRQQSFKNVCSAATN